MNKNNTIAIIGLILITALTRIFPHPNNFAPLGGMALFGGYYFTKKWQAFAVTAGSWWLADLLLNNLVYKRYFPNFTWVSPSFITVAIALIIIILISKMMIKNINILSVVAASLLSSVTFYLITNFGTYLQIYPQSWEGLTSAYSAGIPFFKNTLIGDLFYSAILFGIYYFVINRNKISTYRSK